MGIPYENYEDDDGTSPFSMDDIKKVFFNKIMIDNRGKYYIVDTIFYRELNNDGIETSNYSFTSKNYINVDVEDIFHLAKILLDKYFHFIKRDFANLSQQEVLFYISELILEYFRIDINLMMNSLGFLKTDYVYIYQYFNNRMNLISPQEQQIEAYRRMTDLEQLNIV